MALHTKHYRVDPGDRHALKRLDSDDDGGLDKDRGKEHFEKLRERLVKLQDVLYAQNRHALLVVLQGMDTAGKDSTTREVFAGCSPSSVQVTSFKAPTPPELEHDFLWRVHAAAPRKGVIGVFNRSHYEDVLIVRVRNLVPDAVWKKRYDHINAFEKLLAEEGTLIRKFYLHISPRYQKQRLEHRLEDPDKYWKFDPSDLTSRAHWGQYLQAYQEALARCSTGAAPWYIVPAEHRWFRNLLITQVLVETLEDLKMKYPKPTFDPRKIHVK